MFNPTFDTRLTVDGHALRFAPHPAVPTIVWGQEGRHATVYRVDNNGDAYALKVFRPVFRHDGLIEAASSLWVYNELPGMRVCRQTVIHADTHPELVEHYPDLNYAMLMPWIDGQTWFDYLSDRDRLTPDQCRAITESMAWVLYALELNNLAHCDLSSGNVIVDPDLAQVHLIDVEDLYSPWLDVPPYVPAGSIGYQHRDAAQKGQWGPLGDRFAGAVLMAEMLTWAHPDVRVNAWGESYFAPEELQKDSDRYQLLVDVLKLYDAGFAETFEQAWRSRRLEECPPIKTWYDLLDALPREPVTNWAPINSEDFEIGEPEPVPEPASITVPGVGPESKLSDLEDREREIQRGGCAQGCRRGCRSLFMLASILGILACYAALAVVALSYLTE